MELVYIILLTLSASSVFIYNHTSEDISFILAILTGFTCLFLGFACAPWLLQLLIVCGVLCFYRLYSPAHQGLS